MDVDGGALSSQQTDLEQSLLQEFSRMGTTDKEDLINQMQKLLGPSLNYNTASFFLDMNNWNIQEATCCYLDFQPSAMAAPSLVCALPAPAPLAPYQMSLVVAKHRDPDPDQSLFKAAWSWVVRNTGVEAWPAGCYVRPADSAGSVADVPTAVPPGELCALTFFPPHEQAPRSQMYRLYTPQGLPFGDELWVNVEVNNQPPVQSMDQHQPADENMC